LGAHFRLAAALISPRTNKIPVFAGARGVAVATPFAVAMNPASDLG